MRTRKCVVGINHLVPLFIMLAFLSGLLGGCSQDVARTDAPPIGGTAVDFKITSPAFANEVAIPSKYSCDGQNISPPLQWSDPPPGTGSLALIVDDPDAPAGTWTHWVVFNISPDLRELPDNMQAADLGVTIGENSSGHSNYNGPCPPSGTHHYFFKLYALDTTLSLDKSAGEKQVLAAMEGHILAEADLMGTFSH